MGPYVCSLATNVGMHLFVLSSIFKCNFLVSGRVNDVNDILLLHVKSWCQD